MPDISGHDVRIERPAARAMVSLKVAKAAADQAARRLQLAAPLRVSDTEPQSLWLAPDHWLLASRVQSAETLVARCTEELAGILHLAADYSAALASRRLAGPGARRLLASGSGLDFRATGFPAGTCCRTRFAQVAAVITAAGENEFEIFVDRSYEGYLSDWLSDSMDIAARAAAGQG